MIYVPSAGFNVGGGITQADVDLLALESWKFRPMSITAEVTVALTADGTLTPYAWLELPLPFEIETVIGLVRYRFENS